MTAAVALGLDLGTTRIKLALLGADGELAQVRARPAPRPAGAGLVRELDADAYRREAEALLADAPAGLPLGIASQRSSFLLWDRAGRPATPLVSWQDRSAEAWCARMRARTDEAIEAIARMRARTDEAITRDRASPADEAGALAALVRTSGLVLSPHYAGPKLAALFEARPELQARAAGGELLFGTLETYLVWHWSGGVHATDLSMAARTLLVDLDTGGWSPELCALFGVPARALGSIVPSFGRATELAGGAGRRALRAALADQPAGLAASLGVGGRAGGGALVNLGTGVFCLRPTGARLERRAGYLSAPLLAGPEGTRYALEGTINGGGATADRFAPGPTALPSEDPTPETFCLPDENGVGAPHWRAAQPFHLTAARGQSPADQRRAVLEGLVFRVHAVLEDLGAGAAGAAREERVLVSGGLANEPFLPAALAAVLGRPIEVLLEEETTLLGAARLAAGRSPDAAATRTRAVAPEPGAAWLASKSLAWRRWLEDLLARG